MRAGGAGLRRRHQRHGAVPGADAALKQVQSRPGMGGMHGLRLQACCAWTAPAGMSLLHASSFWLGCLAPPRALLSPDMGACPSCCLRSPRAPRSSTLCVTYKSNAEFCTFCKRISLWLLKRGRTA